MLADSKSKSKGKTEGALQADHFMESPPAGHLSKRWINMSADSWMPGSLAARMSTSTLQKSAVLYIAEFVYHRKPREIFYIVNLSTTTPSNRNLQARLQKIFTIFKSFYKKQKAPDFSETFRQGSI